MQEFHPFNCLNGEMTVLLECFNDTVCSIRVIVIKPVTVIFESYWF